MNPDLSPSVLRCVGPVSALIPSAWLPQLQWAQTIDGFKIEREPNPSKDEQWFQSRLHSMERSWRESPHKTEGTRLVKAVRWQGLGGAVVYRRDAVATRTSLLTARVRIDGQEFILSGKASNEYLTEELDAIQRIARNLRPYDPATTPPKGGLCLDGAIYDGSFTEYSAGMSAEPVAYPGLKVRLLTQAPFGSDPEQAPIARAERRLKNQRITQLAADANIVYEIRHKQRRKTDLFEVEELVEFTDSSKVKDVNDRGSRQIRANARLYAKQSDPGFVVALTATNQSILDNNKPPIPVIPDDDALAMWQAVIRSVQLR